MSDAHQKKFTEQGYLIFSISSPVSAFHNLKVQSLAPDTTSFLSADTEQDVTFWH